MASPDEIDLAEIELTGAAVSCLQVEAVARSATRVTLAEVAKDRIRASHQLLEAALRFVELDMASNSKN